MNGVLDDSQVVRLCIDEEFSVEKIRKYLKQHEQDSKYQGIDAFEWNTAITRNEKKQRNKDEIKEKAFKRAEYERKQKEREERQARREQYEADKAARREVAQKRREEKEARLAAKQA